MILNIKLNKKSVINITKKSNYSLIFIKLIDF